MNKEQSNNMFGVGSIEDWVDDICCSWPFIHHGSAVMAISLLSDVQERMQDHNHLAIHRQINRIKYLLDLDPREELTRRIVGKLMRYLESKGFEIVGVSDEEESYNTDDPAVAMGHVFAVSESSLRVHSQIDNVGREHGIVLIPSNGEDIVSDWSYSKDDVDGFNAVMEAFTNPGE
jgi:hypothetical protein